VLDQASVRLSLDSVPACVTLVRSMLSGLGEHLGFDPELIDDIKTAVSEACNNVVLHAYPGGSGPLLVEMKIAIDALEIGVLDSGCGIRGIAASDDRMGVGLAVISALADTAEFASEPGEGTTVRMSFGSRGHPLDAFVARSEAPLVAPSQLAGDVLLTVAPVSLLGDVLGRVARAVAAGAHFSLDRFADLYLIVDEVAAHAEGAALSSSVSCAISSRAGRLELGVGTLRPGALQAQLGDESEAVSLRRIVNDLQICPDDSGELLKLVVIDPQR
jgi:anti-sigma regulatory factor (Ser/Thr protein kinase)